MPFQPHYLPKERRAVGGPGIMVWSGAIIRLAGASEKALGDLHRPLAPCTEHESLLLLHASTITHLRVFLESTLSAHPDLRVTVVTATPEEELRRVYTDLPILLKAHACTILHQAGRCTRTLAAQHRSVILLKSPPPPTGAGRRLWRFFLLLRHRHKLLVDGRGIAWKGSRRALLKRRLLYMAARSLAPMRDRVERRLLDARLVDDDSLGGTGNRVILRHPQLITQDLATGTVLKPALQARLATSDGNRIYEDGYHHAAIYDTMPDWEADLRRYQERRLRNIREVGIPLTGQALDVGCGTGGLVDALQRSGCQALGIDVSSASIGTARRTFPASEFRVLPFTELAALNQQFELITLSHVLEHAPDDVALLRAIATVLAPGGHLYIEVPWLHRRCNPLRPHWYRQQDHVREYTKAGLRDVVERAGLHIEAHGDGMAGPDPEPFQFLRARIATPSPLSH